MKTIYIVTGDKDSGKTTYISRFVDHRRQAGKIVGGIITEALWAGGQKAGYSVVDLASGEKRRLVFSKVSAHDPEDNREGAAEETFSGLPDRFGPEGSFLAFTPDMECEEHPAGFQQVGRFWVDPAGVALADLAIRSSVNADVLVIDEIGPLELAGGGHSRGLEWALASFSGDVVLAVRRECLGALSAYEAVSAGRVEVITVTPGNRAGLALPPFTS